jgi:glycosyltransferase involved in cell wall biosynthesis
VPFQLDVAPVYRALDVVVHASTKPEPFGLSVLEAMACGRAVVVSDAGGVRELVPGADHALTDPPGDVPALADRMASLLADPVRCEHLGANARRMAASRFDRSRMARRLADVYLSLQAAGIGVDVLPHGGIHVI